MRHLNDSHKGTEISIMELKYQYAVSSLHKFPDDCYNVPHTMLFHSDLATHPPSNSRVSCPSPWIWPAYDSLVTARMWQSASVWHLSWVRRGHAASTWLSWEACSGGHSTAWDHHVGKATHRHWPYTGTQLNPIFPLSPKKCPMYEWGSHHGRGCSSLTQLFSWGPD